MKIIDAHVHIWKGFEADALSDFILESGSSGAVIQAVDHSEYGSLIPAALELKRKYPGRFHVFGAPCRAEYFKGSSGIGERQRDYLKRMTELGIDGIKLLEGKPQMRKAVPVPDFNDECWEPFWKWAEEEQLPVMWHVNDPETNWKEDASPWLVEQGWAYDESFINNEEQYAQVLEVLARHPGMKVIFAHFFFMSAQLGRLAEIMDKYPAVMLDITPGIEMFENFSKDPKETAAFFEKYHNRICYGTDIGGRCILTNEGKAFNARECRKRPEIIRYYLEGKEERVIRSDGDFLIQREPFMMKPLGLEGERLEEIYSGNILRQIGKSEQMK